jgi:hypothetical protein
MLMKMAELALNNNHSANFLECDVTAITTNFSNVNFDPFYQMKFT